MKEADTLLQTSSGDQRAIEACLPRMHRSACSRWTPKIDELAKVQNLATMSSQSSANALTSQKC